VPSETDPDPTSEPLGPAPDDAAGFDAWARQGYDTWQRALVMGEAGRRWADAERPAADRLLAGVWGSSVGAPPASELVPLLDDPSIDPVLRARAQAVVALELVPVRSEDAVQLVEHALAAIGDDVPIRTRLSVWFAACEVYARAGRGPRAVEVLDQAGAAAAADADTPPWGLMAIDAERLALLAPQMPNREQVAAAVDKVAAAAIELPPTPSAIEVVVKMCGLLATMGAARRAERYAEQVLEATVGRPEALGPRFQAQLLLADAVLAAEGPEAAMVAQQAAIDTIAPLGDSPMLGWARRGLAGFLRAQDRNAEAAEEFGRAADTYERAGIVMESSVLRLDQADALLYADRAEEAVALVELVLAGLDQVPEPNRAGVELRAHRVQAHLAAADGDLDRAAEHWLEVAELAPSLGLSDLEARLTAAQLYAADGDDAEADAQFLRAELSAADEADPARATAMVMRVRVDVLRDAGRPDEAAELARLAANHARTSGDEAQAIYLSVVAADSLHAAGESVAAVQLYDDTLQAARDAGMRELEGAVHAGYAAVLRDIGRTDEADAHEAEAQARNPGAPPPR
jgi:tetratricopeptide (TPR) repeat protein